MYHIQQTCLRVKGALFFMRGATACINWDFLGKLFMDTVLVFCYCIINYHKVSSLKQQRFIISVSACQKSRQWHDWILCSRSYWAEFRVLVRL